ncbi:MAG: hypothetical protein EAZ61_08750 [Oscillatoriales cyanobacterium]|jgi:hypothetical protein|nr:MAG: hypothetical protein EAZ61_08750 [Oscillatoriales cyanobacterium]
MPLTHLIRTVIKNRCLLPEQEARIAAELEQRPSNEIDDIELAALSLLNALIANGTVNCNHTLS